MKTLKPQKLKWDDYGLLEDRINDLVWEIVFRPVLAKIKKLLPKKMLPDELKNAPEAPLRKALHDGMVQMTTDAKTGKAIFTLAGGRSSRELADAFHAFGASLDKTRNAYTCPVASVPDWVQTEAKSYTKRAKDTHEEVQRILKDLSSKADHAIDEFNLERGADHAVASIDKGWKDSAKALEIVPELNEEGKRVFIKGLAKTAKIPIKEMAQESIDSLRDVIGDNAVQGYRADRLFDMVRDEYGKTRGRARLIARQETANFMSNYRAAKAKEAGCKRYIWSCTPDDKVRKLHKDYDGLKFFYDKPPIIDERTKKRGNPGQFPNCRCVDIPILEAA